ncbi:histidine--tRNA ligase [archaeon SCG-AAA382B04]|nr:histidine--tRNA ligase [archaeon SCG-AAA382B04]
MKIRRSVEEKIREICENWGYEEIATPTFESLELFELKSGEEIIEEIYEFKDKSERELALRPELTASVMRFYSKELRAHPKPLKLFYFGNCFRYERPQKGRYREFWQFGTEVIGGEREFVEAEIMTLANKIIGSLELDFEFKIGNIAILRSLMNYYDIEQEKQDKVLSEIDKEQENLKTSLEEIGLDSELIQNLIVIKNSSSPIEEAEKQFKELDISIKPIKRFENTIDYLKSFGISDYKIDLSVTRGLDYYIGTVFEIYADGLGAQNQICGGGTYKFPELTKQDISSSGFGLGFDRIIQAMEEQNKIPTVSPRSQVYVAPLSEKFRKEAIELTKKLRKHFSVEVDLKGRGIGDQLSFANRISTPFVILLGEREIEENKISLKDMETGDQEKLSLDKAIKEIKERL